MSFWMKSLQRVKQIRPELRACTISVCSAKSGGEQRTPPHMTGEGQHCCSVPDKKKQQLSMTSRLRGAVRALGLCALNHQGSSKGCSAPCPIAVPASPHRPQPYLAGWHQELVEKGTIGAFKSPLVYVISDDDVVTTIISGHGFSVLLVLLWIYIWRLHRRSTQRA